MPEHCPTCDGDRVVFDLVLQREAPCPACCDEPSEQEREAITHDLREVDRG